jgi:O-methyltransferase
MISGIADVLGPGREYFLFDSFEGLPPAKSIDGASALAWQADKDSPNYLDNCTAAADFANAAMRKSSATRFSLVKGWFDDTLPSFRAPGGIALLRLDGDWYDSTMTCLKFLLPQVVAGGIVIVDDYHTWDGCTRAVHEQLAGTSSCWRIGQYEGDVCTLVRSPELHSGRTSSEDDCASQSATSGGREQPE